MIRLSANGTDYTTEVEGLETFVLDISRNTEDQATELGTTLSITATGTFYDLIYTTFFQNICEGIKNSIDVTVEVDKGSCTQSLSFVLVPEAVDICTSGCADIVLKYVQPEEEKYLCLRNQNSFWSEPGFFDYIKTRSHKILYCQDYTFITYLLFYLYIVTFGIFVKIIKAVCDIGSAIGLGEGDICEALDNLENAVVGCNKFYTAVYLKDILSYNLSKCGLTLQSTIFDDITYSRTALETAIGGEGDNITKCAVLASQFKEKNAPVLNVLQICKILEPIFNSDFRIKGDKFIFERKDWFYENNEIILNIDSSNELEECPKYTVDPDFMKAFWALTFSGDSFDLQGNKNINSYNEVVEWNPTGNINKKGRKELITRFAPAKFSHDEGIIDNYEQQFLGNIRSDRTWLFSIGSCDFTHAQIVQDGQLSSPKLIIIDDKETLNCSCKFATVQKRKLRGSTGTFPFNGYSGAYSYNDALKGQALYDNFHYIDDPNGKDCRYVLVQSVVWYPDNFCEVEEKIRNFGLLVGIESNYYGVTIPESISIDYTDCKITLNNLRFKCE